MPTPRRPSHSSTHHTHRYRLVLYSFTLARLPLIPLACSLSKCLEHTPITPTHRTHSRHTHLRSTHRTQPLLQPFTLVRLPLTPLACPLSSLPLLKRTPTNYIHSRRIYPHAAHRAQPVSLTKKHIQGSRTSNCEECLSGARR